MCSESFTQSVLCFFTKLYVNILNDKCHTRIRGVFRNTFRRIHKLTELFLNTRPWFLRKNFKSNVLNFFLLISLCIPSLIHLWCVNNYQTTCYIWYYFIFYISIHCWYISFQVQSIFLNYAFQRITLFLCVIFYRCVKHSFKSFRF